MMSRENRQRVRSLVELADVAFQALREFGMTSTDAERAAHVVVRALAKKYGGQAIYLAAGANLDVAIRDDHIFRAAGTVSADDLAATYRLSRQRVLQIQCEQRAMYRQCANRGQK